MAPCRAVLVALVAAMLSPVTVAFAQDGEEESRPHGIYIPVPEPEQPEGMAFGAGARTILFLNPNGGRYSTGWADDSTQNVSSILSFEADIPAYPFGAGSWDTFMTCMRGLYAPFDIEVTDVDPGDAAHMEVVVGGHPNHIGMGSGIGGVAPLTCGVVPNAVAYAFPETYGDDPQGICEAAGQESAHAFGLDHEYLCEDILTYLFGCGPKSFQDQDVSCGEYGARQCYCGGATQNSYQYLMGVLGPAENDAPPTVEITSPEDGAGVPPGFAVEAAASDDGAIDRLELYVDGALQGADDAAPWSFTTPADLGAGPHEIEVRAIDDGAHTTADRITVRVDPVSDPGDDDPVGPGDPDDPGVDPGDPDDPILPGDFGAPCDDGAVCTSNACANAVSGDGYCTEECAEGECPLGYECSTLDVGSYCLFAGDGPAGEDAVVGLASGCHAAGAGAPGSAAGLFALGLALALALAVRRR
jgi:hypothetical protein